MIRLNKLVVHSFLFCLNFINCFTDDTNRFVDQYTTRVKLFNDGSALYMYNDYNICEKSPQERAAFCKRTLSHLRKMNDEYKKLYNNYLAFTTGESCSTITVWIRQNNTIIHVLQPALNCFGRSALMSLNKSEKLLLYYQQFVIHPWNTQEMMIFEKIGDNIYILLEIFSYRWTQKQQGIGSTNILFHIPVPQSRTELSTIYEILYPIRSQLDEYSQNVENILYLQFSTPPYIVICMIYESENYSEERSYVVHEHVVHPTKFNVILLSPNPESNVSVSITGIPCSRAISNKGVTLEKIFIAAGPSDHSVILFKEKYSFHNNNKQYEIFELIEYVFPRYIEYYLDRKF